MPTYTSQPDEVDGIDSWIDQFNPTNNNGSSDLVVIGEYNAGSALRRQIIKFDLSKGTNPPPSNASVSSATLYLTPVEDLSNNARTMSAYRIIRSWSESTVTWNSPWATAGCGNTSTDRESASIGTMSVPASPTLGTALSMSLDAAKVQEWISGGVTNNGLLLMVNTEVDDQINYASSANATASYRPKLVIEYSGSSIKKIAGVAISGVKKIAGVVIASVKKLAGV